MDSNIRIMGLEPFFRTDKLRCPLKFGGVVVEESTSMIVKASVENRRGEVAEGFGSMPLIDQWAFPEASVSHERKLEAMKLIGERACRLLEDRWSEKFAHPMDIMLGSRQEILRLGERVGKEAGLEVRMPVLGVLVATSPIDAAIHDAFGRVNGICSYEGYGPRFMEHDLGFYLGSEFRGKYISDYLRPRYAEAIPVFHLVGALDKLRREEVDARDPRDGLPISLEEWIERDGVFCFKVKLSGTDIDWDVRRTKAVAEVAQEVLERRGVSTFYLSADANEMNPDPGATLEYLRRLREASPMAFDRLLYLEQPTERDLAKRRFSMKDVAGLKPVFADEGVTDIETLDLALNLGWSGVAVKVCKWHSSSLLYIAKMEHHGIPYSIQDLTCTGLALVHSAGLAARAKPLMGFEYNARQYLPFAFKEVQKRHESLFLVKDGFVRTDSLSPLGLGFSVEKLDDLI
jgi:L-alanine-DL-glutamate epimerase-like enolase superfamily enzyme